MNTEPCYQFDHATHAMRWSTEVLRGRRFPKIASFYLEAERTGDDAVNEFAGFSSALPRQAEDRFSLAMQVMQCVTQGLDQDQQKLLSLYFWGDFAEPERYRRATLFQERMRQEGKRVRLSYRYSFRQLALLLGVSDKTAAKKVNEALEALEEMLAVENLVEACA